jgi:hypothetical protein
MKREGLTAAFSLALITAVLLTGCVSPFITKTAGPIITRDYDYTDFTSIEIGHAFNLEVTRADTYSISIDAGESVFDHIDVSKVGNKLKIDMDNMFFSFTRSPLVKITMPELQGLEMSGAVKGEVSGFRSSHDFELLLSGASDLDMDMEAGNFNCDLSGASRVDGKLKAANTDIVLSGASKIEMDGSGGNILLEASGASKAYLGKFTVTDATIELSGASETKLDITGKLGVSLSGVSTLEYSGNPTIGDTDISGGSSMDKVTR